MCKKNKDILQCKVSDIDSSFMLYHCNLDKKKYAVCYSRDFKKIFGNKMEYVPEEAFEGILKISNGKHSIYRKYIAGSRVTSGTVQLCSRSMALLRVKKGDKVEVEKSCSLEYMWHSNDSTIRVPFKLAFWGILLTLITGLGSLIVSLFNSCC